MHILHRLAPKRVRGSTYGGKLLQTKRQRVSHVLWVGLIIGRWRGQQEPRFQIGKPSGHHQIVRSQFQALRTRLLDELRILIDQGHDRDMFKIDFLRARHGQQQIDWSLKTIDVDDKGLIGIGLGGCSRGVKQVGHGARNGSTGSGLA